MAKRTSIEIGENIFSTKKAALAFYRDILNSYEAGDEIKDEDFELVFSLLKIHPHSANKIGKGVARITVERDAYSTTCFHVIRTDSSKENFSYIKCINGDPNDFTNFSKACRKAVEEDLKKVKQDYFEKNSKEGKVKCQDTGQLIGFDEAHVDHRQPNTFSVIVDRFVEIKTIDLKSIRYDNSENYGHEFEDKLLTHKFREYHKEKANLRVVQKTRNLARSYQARIGTQIKDLRIK